MSYSTEHVLGALCTFSRSWRSSKTKTQQGSYKDVRILWLKCCETQDSRNQSEGTRPVPWERIYRSVSPQSYNVDVNVDEIDGIFMLAFIIVFLTFWHPSFSHVRNNTFLSFSAKWQFAAATALKIWQPPLGSTELGLMSIRY